MRGEGGLSSLESFSPLQRGREWISPCSAEPSVHTSRAHSCILELGSSHALVQTQQHPEQRAWGKPKQNQNFPFPSASLVWCSLQRAPRWQLTPPPRTRSSDRAAPQQTRDTRLMTKGIPLFGEICSLMLLWGTARPLSPPPLQSPQPWLALRVLHGAAWHTMG